MTWKKIKGYNDYEVSDDGQVRSLKNDSKKILKGSSNGEYKSIGLCENGKRKFFFVHRLIVETFDKKIPDGMVVNHIDNNGHNNNISNLEIVTSGENSRMAVNKSTAPKGLKAFRDDIGEMYKNGKSLKQIGENYGCRSDSIWYQLQKAGITRKDRYEPDKISDEDAEDIRKSYKRGVDLAVEYGVDPSYIWKIKNNKRKTHKNNLKRQ